MGYALEYAPAIMRRGRVGMDPVGFEPDWPDAPRKGKYYPTAASIRLPHGSVADSATLQAGLDAKEFRDGAPAGRFTLPLLSGMLLDTYAMLGRRLAVQANSDLAALPAYATANWFRGTASGGGLYPCTIYWASGPSGPMTPGIYFYSSPRHAMQPLLRGDISALVRFALGDIPGVAETDQFLIVGIKYWQNAFKYNNFGYHVVSMDLGAMLEGWRTWAAAQALRMRPALWFEEARLAELLGVSPTDEGIFAVVPLPWKGERAQVRPRGEPARRPTVVHADQERSRRVLRFDLLRRMQEATVGHAADRPAPGALHAGAALDNPAAGRPLQLPAPQPLTVDLRTTLRRRRSSFGRFSAHQPIAAAQLAALLAASASVRIECDVSAADDPRLTSLYVFVNHVEDVAPGIYAYDAPANALRLIKAGPCGKFLDDNYFLANYSVDQAAAAIVPTLRSIALLEALGDRGYNLVNATIGAIAQTCYSAAAAMEIGCGVALGFDNVSFIEELRLESTGESPLLLMMVGRERRQQANYRYEIV